VTQILFSFIIPVYNLEAYIERCLRSVIDQTYKNIEVVIVDDGSTDKSLSVVRAVCCSDNRIKIIEKNNEGLSSARNAGLECVSGQYVFFVDGDDWVDIDLCQKIFNEILFHAPDVIVYDLFYVGKYGASLKKHSEKNSYSSGLSYLQSTISNCSYSPTVCNKSFKRSCIGETRFPVGLMYEDVYFSFVSLLNADVVTCIDDSGYYYDRNRNGSITSTISAKNVYDLIDIVARLDKYLILKDMFGVLSSVYYSKYKMERYINELLLKLVDGSRIEDKKSYLAVLSRSFERFKKSIVFSRNITLLNYFILKLFFLSPFLFQSLRYVFFLKKYFSRNVLRYD